ncbi:ATP-binding protein [Nucisporomicrobium flavum]|uniref:ATP-binding protein n=1 Tax=Nucisporomicrobium flavum TaxID=2785915 RepID=UPI003C2EC5CB
MTSPSHEAGRPLPQRAAGAVRGYAADPITRRVAAVVTLGAALGAVVVVVLPGRASVLAGVGVPAARLVPGLVVLTCLAEITVVRLRHGEAVEELSLYEAALIIDVLLLPPRDALLAAVAGLVLASVVQRRPAVKALFNLGTYTAAVSVLILLAQLVGGAGGALTVRVLAGVLIGTLAFTMVNLCCLAQILAVINGVPAWAIVRDEARLSVSMALGTVATGLTTTAVALHTPVLLPFMAMPAIAVTYAYRAAAREADERARSSALLRLSEALAGREDVIRRFLVLVREAFDAEVGVIVLSGSDVALSVEADEPSAVRTGPPPAYLAGLVEADAPVQLTENLPAGLRHAVVIPVEGGGGRFGAAAFASRGRRRMSTGDVTLLASLGNALAVAIRGAEHLERLTEERSKLQAVVEQSAEGIMVVDGAGLVQVWNQALGEMAGIPAAEATGRPLSALLEVPADEERAGLLPVDEETPRVATELTIRRPDGEERRLRLAHSAIFAAGELVRDVVVISDLTREYRTERLKSDFIAMVSHELRTPLTPILGYVDLLRTRGERMTPQKRADALALIGDRAAHLSRLVEDLLLASRVGDRPDEAGLQVAVATHDLAAIVRQAVGDLGSGRVVLTGCDEEWPARCDPGRTVQVLTNLIGNGLKYSAEDRTVEVSLRRAAGMLHVDVSDHGRGIPADSLEKVFEKFHRVEDPMTMSTSGTGLGLFIARRLARAMGGDVTLQSRISVGSVFTLSLPPPD